MEFDQPSKENNQSPEDKETKKRKRKRRPARVPLDMGDEGLQHEESKAEEPIARKTKKKRKTKEAPKAEVPSGASEDKQKNGQETSQEEDVLKSKNMVEEAPSDERVADLPLESEQEPEAEIETPTEPAHEAVLPIRQVPEHEEELFISDRLRRLQELDEGHTETAKSSSETLPDEDNKEQTRSTASGQANAHRSSSTTSRQSSRTRLSPSGSSAQPVITPTPSPNRDRPPITSENTAPSAADINDRLYYAERNGARRGVLSGLVLGAMIEHFRHKKREKKLKAQLKGTEKSVKKLEANEHYLQKEMAKNEREAGRRKTTLERQIERLRAVSPTVPVTVQERIPPVETKKENPEVVSEKLSQSLKPKTETIEASSPFRSSHSSETPLQKTAERKQEGQVNPDIEKAKQAVERAIENQVIEVPEGHRLQTSAWHTIEVDKKTGRAVEDSSIEYGEEFKHEQHQEQLHQASDKVNGLNSDSQGQQSNYELFQQATTPKLPEHATPDKSKKDKPLSPPSLQSMVNDAEPIDIALWVMLLIVVIAIIIAL